MIKEILFPTDFSPHSIATFALAADIAVWHDAVLHVLHVVQDSPLFANKEFDSGKIAKEAEDTLRTSFWHRLPVQLQTDRRFKPLVLLGYNEADIIVEYGESHGIDLVVMATHGRRGLIHPLGLGGTAGNVLRRVKTAALTWHPPAQQVDHPEWKPPTHILVPVDFSDQTHEALRIAKIWAGHYNASLSVIFVAEERIVPIFNDTLIPSIYVMKPDEEQLEHVGDSLSQLFHSIEGPTVTPTFHVRKGHPANEILTFIDDEEVDLVIMSSHGHTAGRQFSMGSTADKIARKARCAVYTNRAKFV